MGHKRREIARVDGGERLPAAHLPYGGADRSVRAADQDRERAIELLNQHTTAGRLTLAEFEERVSAVYAAPLLSDVDHQLRDLPVQRTAPAEPEQRVALWHMWMPWVSAGIICWVIWGISEISSPERAIYPWPLWVVGPWGAVLLSRTIAYRASRPRRR